MNTTEIRGCEIAHDVSGSGVDFVWGHGLTQSRALEDRLGLVDWASIPARVLRYDARGHGESESTPDPDDSGWDRLALDQLALADAVGLDSYVAGGASMGSATALHSAVISPDRILGLVLVIPPTGWEARAGQAAVYEQGAQIVESSGVDLLIASGAAVAPPDPFIGDAEYRQRRADGMRSWDPHRLAQAMRGATRAQLPDRERIAEITCPTLILAWTGDAVHPVATAAELVRLIPHAEHHVASNADDLTAWTGLVARFLQSITA